MKFIPDRLPPEKSIRAVNARQPDFNAVLYQLLETREVREAIGNVLPGVLGVYAGQHPLKRLISGIVAAHIRKSLSRPRDHLGNDELPRLFSDPGFMTGIVNHISDFWGYLLPLVSETLSSIEKMPDEKREAIITTLIPGVAAGHAAGIMTTGLRIINQLHESDPEFFAKKLTPAVYSFVEAFDFAELKDAVEKSEQDIDAFIKTASSAIWKYPTKVVLLLSLMPNFVNILSRTSKTLLSGFNVLPPDLLADVTNSFINEIDAEALSCVVNEFSELVRKFDTGSSLIGDSGSPAFSRVADRLAADIVSGLDPKVVQKALTGLSRTRAAIGNAAREAVNNNPELKKALSVAKIEDWNIRVRNSNNAVAFMETLDDQQLCEDLSDYLGLADLQELAEAANQLLAVFNRVCDTRPALPADLAGKFGDFVDTYELSEAARHMREDAAPGFRKTARAVLPDLVIWACDVLSPQDDENEDMAKQARQALAALIVS